jgi:hypothetical protein
MTPLFKKLNYKEGSIVALDAPKSFNVELNLMKEEAKVFTNISKAENINFVIGFVTKLQEVENIANAINTELSEDLTLWLCYPKGTSKKHTCEFNRDTGWASLGAINMEPVRQVAIDEDWSALRFRKVAFIKKLTRNVDYALSVEAKERIKVKGI